jgi:hypothetical protein
MVWKQNKHLQRNNDTLRNKQHHMHYCVPQGPLGVVMGSTLGKVYIPLCGISHGMQGTVENTKQDYVNQIERGGDAPAPEVQNRGVSAGLGGQVPQDYEQDYGMELKRGDIYVWNGREGRKV